MTPFSDTTSREDITDAASQQFGHTSSSFLSNRDRPQIFKQNVCNYELMNLMDVGYIKEFQNKMCFSYLHVIVSYLIQCSYEVSMSSLRSCSVNSHENEKKDMKFIGCVQTSDWSCKLNS